MSIENVKTAVFSIPLGARKTQNPASIVLAKENFMANLTSPGKMSTRNHAIKPEAKPKPSVILEIRDQEKLRKDYQELEYPNSTETDVLALCEACWTFQREKQENTSYEMLKCEGCHARLHKHCEQKEKRKLIEYNYCCRCKEVLCKDLPTNSIKCAFCPFLNGLIIPFRGNVWGHLLCIQYFSHYYRLDNSKNEMLLPKILEEVRDNGKTCCSCRKTSGFWLQCLKCPAKMHVSCGLRKGLLRPLEGLNQKFLCSAHCEEKIKASFLKQRFSALTTIKPLNVSDIKLYTLDELLKKGILSFPEIERKLEASESDELVLHLKPEVASLFGIGARLEIEDMEKLRKKIVEFFKEKGLVEITPKKGVNVSKCQQLLDCLEIETSGFIDQRNLWKTLERGLFSPGSYYKLTGKILRSRQMILEDYNNHESVQIQTSKRKKKKVTTKKKVTVPKASSIAKKQSHERNGDRLLKQEILDSDKRMLNQEENIERNGIILSQESLEINGKQLLSKESLGKNGIKPSKESKRSKTKELMEEIIQRPGKRPMRTCVAKCIAKAQAQGRLKKFRQEVDEDYSYERTRRNLGEKSRSRSRSESAKMRRKHLIKRPIYSLNDLLNKMKETNGDIAEEEEEVVENNWESSPSVSEKEIKLRRQINEDKVRKHIARIDAPGYSIDGEIIYFKDLENVARREDLFDDLMGDLFRDLSNENMKKEQSQSKQQKDSSTSNDLGKEQQSYEMSNQPKTIDNSLNRHRKNIKQEYIDPINNSKKFINNKKDNNSKEIKTFNDQMNISNGLINNVPQTTTQNSERAFQNMSYEEEKKEMILLEDENMELKESDNILREKTPAFEFTRKEPKAVEEWIEKRWALSRKPFTCRHLICSVDRKCLENPENEKDLGNIGKHFYDLKLT